MSGKGKFIVFEGGEGSGKTKHSKIFVQRLEEQGYEVVHTHEPGGTGLGKLMRKIILYEGDGSLVSRAELFLFLADRAQHVEELIRPALEAGKTVVCDRFSGSTFAYQLGGRQLPDEQLIHAMDNYARSNIEPDFVMYLDIDPLIGIGRKKEKEMNRMDKEELDFHRRVREYFLRLVDKYDHWLSIPTEGPKEVNADKIYNAIVDYLKL